MSLTIKTGVQETDYTGNTAEKTKAAEPVKSINASETNIAQISENSVDEKKDSALKQAMKLIADAWEKDQKAEQGIDSILESKDGKVLERNEINQRIADIEASKEDLQEEYGVDADSEEQKDLELLEKYQNNKAGVSFDKFSEDEMTRLEDLANTSLTEYQKRVLEVNDVEGYLSKEIEGIDADIKSMTEQVSQAKLDRLKSQTMIKAQDAADSLLGAAQKEIVGMLFDEGVDNIDENINEQWEDRKEAAQEQESKASTRENDNISEAQKNIQKLMDNNSLINEDIKGIEIDLNF